MILKTKDLKKRYSIFPVTHMDLWEKFYVPAVKQFWEVDEAALSDDKFNELEENEKIYLKKYPCIFCSFRWFGY
jgi:hypothetical protein